jgi:hypothetical protein
MSDASPDVKNSLWFLTGCLATALILGAVRGPEVACASLPQVETHGFNLIEAKEKQFIDYEQDFIDLSKAAGAGSFEGGISMGLHDTAERVQLHLDAASTLVWVYNIVSCVPDKVKIRPMISKQLSNYVALINLEISLVNNNLARTTVPGVVATANQMKADMRSAQMMLTSLVQTSLN